MLGHTGTVRVYNVSSCKTTRILIYFYLGEEVVFQASKACFHAFSITVDENLTYQFAIRLLNGEFDFLYWTLWNEGGRCKWIQMAGHFKEDCCRDILA